jgi:hypothetical protein
METTSKKFIYQIQNHIYDRLSEDLTTELSEQLKNAMDEFNDWYSIHERQVIPDKYDAFKKWLWGIPSCLSVEYVYYNIIGTLKDWFYECGEKYIETDDQTIDADLYMNLITREFFNMYNNHCTQAK